MPNEVPLPNTWIDLLKELDESRTTGMSVKYLSTAQELGHMFFWKHFIKITRDRWTPDSGTTCTIDNAINTVRLMLRSPASEYLPYARSATAVSEKELDFYVMAAAMKLRASEGSHPGEQGVWAYSVYGLMDALSKHKFEKVLQ